MWVTAINSFPLKKDWRTVLEEIYGCPCTQWSVGTGDVSWKNPRKKKEGTKSRKWLLKTKMLRVKGTQRSTLWPREVFWPLYYEKEKVLSCEGRRWGLEYTQTASGNLPLGKRQERKTWSWADSSCHKRSTCVKKMRHGNMALMERCRNSEHLQWNLSTETKRHVVSLIGGIGFFPKKSEKLRIFVLLLYQFQELAFFCLPVSCIFILTVLGWLY